MLDRIRVTLRTHIGHVIDLSRNDNPILRFPESNDWNHPFHAVLNSSLRLSATAFQSPWYFKIAALPLTTSLKL